MLILADSVYTFLGRAAFHAGNSCVGEGTQICVSETLFSHPNDLEVAINQRNWLYFASISSFNTCQLNAVIATAGKFDAE